ncbi:PQQ-binding-like beta-propeller repeat protein [Streptomyces sp. NPDC046324]|uniref:outer membrane protein assembly factor BamB family protein n=1 Tax=Streptomyces sp. NPDC046324 TaxID=3154915 RepID=UPI0033EE4D18
MTEAPAECGGDDCPPGFVGIMLTAIGLGLFAALVMPVVLGWLRPDDGASPEAGAGADGDVGQNLGSRDGRRTPASVLRLSLGVLAALVGLWAGWQTYGWMRGPHVEVAWQAPAEGGPADARVLGVWDLDGGVTRIRADGLTTYGTAHGAERWRTPAPARQSVCALSARAERGVGLLAYGRHGKPCAVLAAVRADDGRTVWRQPVAGAGVMLPELALGGGTVVAVEDRAVRARSTEAGSEQWTRPLADNCRIVASDATAARTLLVESCTRPLDPSLVTARLLALDTRTGVERWAARLPVVTTADIQVLSVAPAVIAVGESDPRGTRAVLTFDAGGAPTATIPFTGQSGELVLSARMSGGPFGDGRPLVHGDLLVTTRRDGFTATRVVAHSLKDGREVWRFDSEGSVTGQVARPDGRLAVLTSGLRLHLIILDAATGTEREDLPMRDASRTVPAGAVLLPSRDGLIVVAPGTDAPPVMSLR